MSLRVEKATWYNFVFQEWAASSVGRALRSQRRGREFEPRAVHQIPLPRTPDLSATGSCRHTIFPTTRVTKTVIGLPEIRRFGCNPAQGRAMASERNFAVIRQFRQPAVMARA